MAINDTHADYRARVAQWKRCRDVMEGSDAVKLAGVTYLPMLKGQTFDEYEAYKCRALFFNGTARTRAALTGSVSAKDPSVKLPDALPERLAPHLADITEDGTPLNDFAVALLDEVITVGRCGILVDFRGDAVNAADHRPYWVLFQAEQIVNWRVTKVGGSYRLSLVVLKEFETEAVGDNYATQSVEQYRVLELNAAGQYQVSIYRQDRSKAWKAVSTVVPVRRGTPLDYIPFVFVSPTSITPSMDKPPLLDMVDVNLSHYRTSADLEHGLHFVGLPTPWAVGLPANQHSIAIGPTNVWKLSGPNAAAGMLEFKGEGLGELRTALTSKAEMMAVLGARLIEQPLAKGETAESVRTRNAATYATLRTIVNAVSLAMTTALRWHIWWAGFEVPADSVGVELNREFVDITVTADELKSLVIAYQQGAMSFETLYWNLSRGHRVRPGVTAEDEKQAIAAGKSNAA